MDSEDRPKRAANAIENIVSDKAFGEMVGGSCPITKGVRDLRPMPWRLPFLLAGSVMLLGVGGPSGATHNSSPVVASGKRLELDVTGPINGPGYHSGEPQVAINPLDPRQVFIAYSTSRYTGSLDPKISFEPSPPHSCGGMISNDRGESWSPAFLPYRQKSKFTLSQCANGVAAYGPDGTLYAGGAAFLGYDTREGTPPNCPAKSLPIYAIVNAKHFQVCIEFYGTTMLARSTDGGRTWTDLPRPLGTPGTGTFRFASDLGQPAGVFDRPQLAIDQSTGALYFSATKIGGNRQRFVTVSKDKGSSWGTIHAIDNPIYPQAYFKNPRLNSANIAAAHGAISVAYIADPAPGGCHATCVVFASSHDDGSTWERMIVPTTNIALDGGPNAGVLFVAADPTAKGNFAVLTLDSSETLNQVYSTSDSGRTWSGPVVVADQPRRKRFNRWFSYSPAGHLLLAWRTWNGTPDVGSTSYDTWAAIRHPGSLRFSAPLRVSSKSGRYAPECLGGVLSGCIDSFSYITGDRDYVAVAWGDSRSGEQQVWYSRIPIEEFKFKMSWAPHDESR